MSTVITSLDRFRAYHCPEGQTYVGDGQYLSDMVHRRVAHGWVPGSPEPCNHGLRRFRRMFNGGRHEGTTLIDPLEHWERYQMQRPPDRGSSTW